MTLDQMKAVLAIARCGTFSAAARELFVTQPALSMQVRNLEQGLEAKLFERLGRRVLLTDAGRAVCECASSVLGDLKAVRNRLQCLRKAETGTLAVAAGDTVTRYRLMTALAAYRLSHPGVQLLVWNKTSREIRDMVVEGKADIGILSLPLAHPLLTASPLFSYELVAVRAKQPSPAVERITLRSLAQQNLLLLERGTRSREVIEAALAAEGVSPQSTTELGSVDIQKDLAAIGAGTAIVPDYSVGDTHSRKTLEVCRVRGLPRLSVGIVRRKTETSALVAAFTALLNG